jgi:hypothetical protein
MFPMDRKPTPLMVEYSVRGRRVLRWFPDAFAARRFYKMKVKAGAAPRVLAPEGGQR